MRRWILVTAVIFFLLLSFAVMASSRWLKQPLNPNQDVMAFVQELDATIRPEPDWVRAEEVRQKIKAAWQPVRFRIQFVAEKDDIIRFTRAVDELKASIAVHDVSMAKHKVELLRSLWDGIR